MARVKNTMIRQDHRQYQIEAERVAENINNQFRNQIKDRDTFDDVIEAYIGKPENKKQEKFFNQVFAEMQKRHPQRISKERLFTKAGGKNLRQDKKKTAKIVLTDPKEYKRRGAQKTDLKGLDTATTGKIKGRVVIVNREILKIKKGKQQGRTIIRYRDSKGRFASRK